ncbi:hypothetical protein Tco_0016962 [Tanacetum coccineum]
MSSITAQQTKLDIELVPKENRFDIRKCNGIIPHGFSPRKPTFQVTLDAIALTPCYPAFLITADVLEICPRVQDQDFDALPTEEDIVSFLRDFGHTGDITSLNDVVVDQMHQPWRTFAALINRSLSGKTSGLDKLCLSKAQIIWGMHASCVREVINVILAIQIECCPSQLILSIHSLSSFIDELECKGLPRILKDGHEGSIKVKEFQRSFRHFDTERLSRSDEVLQLKNLKKDAILKFFKITYQERYEHVSPEVTSSQDGKVYKMANQDYAWLMISRRIMDLAATGPAELWRYWPCQSSAWCVSRMPQVSSLGRFHRMPGMSAH